MPDGMFNPDMSHYGNPSDPQQEINRNIEDHQLAELSHWREAEFLPRFNELKETAALIAQEEGDPALIQRLNDAIAGIEAKMPEFDNLVENEDN